MADAQQTITVTLYPYRLETEDGRGFPDGLVLYADYKANAVNQGQVACHLAKATKRKATFKRVVHESGAARNVLRNRCPHCARFISRDDLQCIQNQMETSDHECPFTTDEL